MTHARPHLVLTVGASLATLLLPAAGAQVATSLLTEGDALPAAGAGHVVSSISNTAVNGVGGYAASINSTDGVTTLSHQWGSATDGPGAILRTEGLVGVYEQTGFESFFGLADDGTTAYGATCIDTGTLVSGLDGAFFGGTVVAMQGEPIPSLPGKEFRFASRPGTTNDGTAYWVSGINDTTSGANEGNGLFTPGGVLHKTGDVIAGLPAPLGSSAIDFDVRFSAQGSHYILGVDTTATSSADFFMLLDGAPIPSGAGVIGEGQPVPAADGGLPGELWAGFDYLGVNEAGDFLITGATSGAGTATDEFISLNGAILYREGDVVDGETLTGAMEGAFMNEAGDIAYIWDIVDGGGSLEALFLNDRLLLEEGDLVDLFGQDGLVEATSVLENFTGLTSVTAGPTRSVFFTADIDVNGTATTTDDIEGFFRFDANWTDLGNGLAGTGGLTPELVGTGSLVPGAAASLVLSDALPGSQTWLLIGLSQIDAPFKGGVLVPSPDIVIPALPVFAGGGLTLPFAWFTVPSGTAVFFQHWVLDPGGVLGFAASNGVVGVTP